MHNSHLCRSEPEDSGQTSIDFLIGMAVFAGVFFFVFQFSSAAIGPFVFTSEEVPTKTQSVADKLYFEELQGEQKGELNLTYLQNNRDDISQIEEDLDMEVRYGLNITVSDISSDDVEFAVSDGGDSIPPPDTGASVSRTTRFGEVADDGGMFEFREGDKVIIRVRVW